MSNLTTKVDFKIFTNNKKMNVLLTFDKGLNDKNYEKVWIQYGNPNTYIEASSDINSVIIFSSLYTRKDTYTSVIKIIIML